jgi:glycerol uptake facilitator protein
MNHFTGEVVGTAILILFGDGVVAGVLLHRSKAQNSGWIVITMGWGLAVAIAVFAVGKYSGAIINPAVAIGFAVTSKSLLKAGDLPTYIGGEFLGAFIGAVLVYLAYLPHWRPTEDQGLKLAVYCTGPAIRNYAANLLTEIIGTAILVLGVLAIINNAGAVASGLVPLLIGFLVVAIGLSLGGPTGYAINPARDLGPRIAHFVLPIAGKGSSDWAYAWVPVVGPIIGGIIGGLGFKVLFPHIY